MFSRQRLGRAANTRVYGAGELPGRRTNERAVPQNERGPEKNSADGAGSFTSIVADDVVIVSVVVVGGGDEDDGGAAAR